MGYEYQTGESFKYKWWSVKVEEYGLGARMQISFFVDGFAIYNAILSALNDNKMTDHPEVKEILKNLLMEITKLIFEPVDSFKVFHTFGYWEKCRQDAVSHIDNVLGDGLSYAKKNDLIPSLKYFM